MVERAPKSPAVSNGVEQVDQRKIVTQMAQLNSGYGKWQYLPYSVGIVSTEQLKHGLIRYQKSIAVHYNRREDILLRLH